jgi:nucleotide-binding universal stress UspA family protein
MIRDMKTKKIVIAVNLEENTQRPLKGLKDLEFAPDAEIHLVHVMQEILYAKGLQSYPLPEERPRIEERILAVLSDIQQEFLPGHKRVVRKCIFDTNVKASFTDYVKQQGADLVVVATRGKYGPENFFDSSFAQHQLKYSPGNVLILR